jgi:hypothetical protein
MQSWRALLMATVVAVLLPTVAHAAVRVTFVAPERYRDSDFRSASQRAGILGELKGHIERLGDRYLKRGQTLTIEVLDIDLAGRYEPWRPNLSHARIMRDTTPPMMKLRYTLQQNGRVVRRGSETVTDMNYLMWNSGRFSSERLTYEKEMLTDWFQARFSR